MTVLTQLVLSLALAGAGDAEDLRAEALRQGAAPDVEALQDFRRRTPSVQEAAPASAAPQPQEGEKQEPPPTPAPRGAKPQEEETPSIDFSWLELYPRIGMAVFSSRYHVSPSACFGVVARAPMPWLSPDSNPHGEYFGLFAELDVAVIKRDIFPKLEKDGGPIFMVGFGIDYTIYRNESWLLMVEAGVHYVHFGGITDLTNGMTPMFGLIAGLSVSRGISLSLSPEIEYPKTGDYIMMLTLGLVMEF
jgi:hypothetical protein